MSHTQNHIYKLMARALSNEATEMERQELHKRLEENESLRAEYDMMQRLWRNKGPLHETPPNRVNARVNRILQQAIVEDIAADSQPVSYMRYVRIAMAAAAIIAIVLFSLQFLSKPASTPMSIAKVLETQKGSRSRNILPDGSIVWLNAGSKMKLLPGYNELNRRVAIEGEAYFDVIKSKKPFIVYVADVTLTVLGTTFNVKFFPGDKNLETTLVTGSLKVQRQGQQPVIMKPKEKIVLAATTTTNVKQPGANYTFQPIETLPTNAVVETAWLYNRLEFRGDDFATLAARLERWYNVEIAFEDEAVKKLSFNGSFENETISEALKALQLVAPFTYKINNHEIYIGSLKQPSP